MGHTCFVLMSIKHIHTSSSLTHIYIHTHTQRYKSRVLASFHHLQYNHHLIAAFHEPCNQRGRGREEKTTITERSAVKLLTGPLPSPSIITSITSHTQSCFHVIPSPKPCSVGRGAWRNQTGVLNKTIIFQQKCFSPLYFFINFFGLNF